LVWKDSKFIPELATFKFTPELVTIPSLIRSWQLFKFNPELAKPRFQMKDFVLERNHELNEPFFSMKMSPGWSGNHTNRVCKLLFLLLNGLGNSKAFVCNGVIPES
jgi:hypothetical protein